MKHFYVFLFLFLVSGCSSNRYYLDDANPDRKFLVEKINEFSQKGLTTNEPILVIDGVEYIDLKQIDLRGLKLSKEDIKSIELLKKDAAVRVFGKNGERGVLLITTKNADVKG